jgi:hypothetical protein
VACQQITDLFDLDQGALPDVLYTFV